jgi:integrase
MAMDWIDGPQWNPRRGREPVKPLADVYPNEPAIDYIIRGALERAVRWGYLGVNPAAMAYAPTPAKTKPDPPTAAEAAALLNEAWRDPEWGLLLWLTMVTGCRRGELCSIRWRHVDFDRADLWIELATAQSRSGILEKVPKSGEGRRISLDPQTLALLRQHKLDVSRQLLDLGVPLTGDAFVFSVTPDYSQPRKPRSVTQKYRLMAAKLRLRSTRLHALRHYSATELLTAGVDLRTVAGRLGHGDGTTTLRTYAAWVAAADRRAAEQIAELMPVVVPQPPRPRGPYESIADGCATTSSLVGCGPGTSCRPWCSWPRSTPWLLVPRTARWRSWLPRA